MSPLDRLLHYGVDSALARRAEAAGLAVTKIRAMSREDIITKFGLTAEEAVELKKCVVRQPMAPGVVDQLLERSNHTCCVRKGVKSGAIILHHIAEYEISQDNSYTNLAVLCPSDHDRAHRGGLTLGLSPDQIRRAKGKWEAQVEVANVQAAARAVAISDDAIDYVNVMRIEEMCVRRLGEIPQTTISPSLQRAGILGQDRYFNEMHVRKKLSRGAYLFDYHNCSETEHYRQLLERISEVVMFEDLSEAARSGIRRLHALEGKYAYFVGGVHSRQPELPIGRKSTPLIFHYTARRVRITWDGDPNHLMSMSAISRQGRTNRYIIYGLVRTVHQEKPGSIIQVTASPLLIAQPTAYVDRTPAISWRRQGSPDSDELQGVEVL